MKKLTRSLTLALAIMLLFALNACNTASSGVTLKILDTEYAIEDYAIAIAKENTELLDKVNTALEELIADGTVEAIVNKYISGEANDLVFQQDADGKEELHMGTNAEFPPYEFYDEDSIVGIDAEVAAAIADKLDMKLVIDDMAFDAVIVAVQEGKVDMGMAGLTVSEERLKSINFTTSYATGVQVVIVTEDSAITSVDDLFADGADHSIGVQSATTGDLYSTEEIEDAGLGTIQRYNKGADAVAALVAGKIDCVIIDNEPAKAFVAANNK